MLKSPFLLHCRCLPPWFQTKKKTQDERPIDALLMDAGNFGSWQEGGGGGEEIITADVKWERAGICGEEEVCSFTSCFKSCLFCLFFVFAVKTTAWRTSQSPYPKDIQMGSSPTATAAIESRWPCRNTWQRFWDEGTDRELGTKDVDWPICSVVKAPKLNLLCIYIQSLNQSHSDISDQPVDCACVLSTCIYVWSKAIKMNILIIIISFFFFLYKSTWYRTVILCGPIFYFHVQMLKTKQND